MAAARMAVDGRERMIDVAEADGEVFLGIASLGFDSDANRIANESRVIRGNLVYLYAALRALWSWKAGHFTVTVDGEAHQLTGYSVGAANSKAYGGGMYVAPQAELDDGQLDIVALGNVSKLTFLGRVLPKVFRGTHIGEDYVTVLRGRRIEIDADRRFRVYADGDPIADVPVTITVAQRCLRVVGPGVSPSLTRGAARTVRSLSRRLGRGGGTTLPGRLLLRADPDAMRDDGRPSWTRARC